MSCRGLSDLGRPPLFTTARASMASVSSGSSLYSCGLILCASTRDRSDPEVRREAGLLTIVGLSHAEDMALRATRGVPHNHHSAFQLAEADDATFTVLLANILDLDRHALEDKSCVLEVQATIIKRLLAFGRIVGDSHPNIVYTLTTCRKPSRRGGLRRLTFELSRALRQVPTGRGRTMTTMAWSGQAVAAVARRLERGVRPHLARWPFRRVGR